MSWRQLSPRGMKPRWRNCSTPKFSPRSTTISSTDSTWTMSQRCILFPQNRFHPRSLHDSRVKQAPNCTSYLWTGPKQMSSCVKCNRACESQEYRCYYGRRYYWSSGGYRHHRWELLGSVAGYVCSHCINTRRLVIVFSLALAILGVIGIVLIVYPKAERLVWLLLFGFFSIIIIIGIDAESAGLSLNTENV